MDDSKVQTSIPDEEVLESLCALDVASEEIVSYGIHPRQFIEWYGPAAGQLVVLVHGIFADDRYGLPALRPAALALGEAGYRVALVEYRREAGDPSVTLEDTRTLARLPQLLGATWIGFSSGAIPVLDLLFGENSTVRHGVLLAPIIDLRQEVEEKGIYAKAAQQWMGDTPEKNPDLYAQYDPAVAYARLGADAFTAEGYRLDIVHGTKDQIVPAQRTYNLAKEPFNIALVPEANHYDLICPGHDAWILLLGALCLQNSAK